MGPCSRCEITDGQITRMCERCTIVAEAEESAEEEEEKARKMTDLFGDEDGVMDAENEGDMASKLARLANVKRGISTPGQSPVVVPPTSKARGEEPPLAPVPKFPFGRKSAVKASSPPAPAFVAAAPAGTPPPPLDSGNPILDAINKLSAEMHSMRVEAVTKKDITDLRTSISQEIRGSITAAVSPLKEDIAATRSEIGDLRNRVSVLESIPTGSSSSGMNISTVISPEVKSMLDSLDPAHRQIVFTGFDLSMTQPDRTKMIQNFISGFSTVPSSSNFGAILTGPSNKRVITDKSYVEFSSIDDARAALKIMESGVFHVSGKETRVKAALSKINRSRN